MAAPSFAGIGGAVVHARGVVAHHALAAADQAREGALHVNLVPLLRQRQTDRRGHTRFHRDVAAGEGELGHARGFERRLDVHAVIDHVRDELHVGLRLVPSAHDAEGHLHVARGS